MASLTSLTNHTSEFQTPLIYLQRFFMNFIVTLTHLIADLLSLTNSQLTRMYLRHLKLEGESQEQDRIVEFFSKRYNTSNPYKIGSAGKYSFTFMILLVLW